MVTEQWWPKLDDEVWFNYPDHPERIGVVVGFVPEDAEPRAGQPIIREDPPKDEEEVGGFLDFRTKGESRLVVIHPRFLLPFPYRGDEWHAYNKAGLIQ